MSQNTTAKKKMPKRERLTIEVPTNIRGGEECTCPPPPCTCHPEPACTSHLKRVSLV